MRNLMHFILGTSVVLLAPIEESIAQKKEKATGLAAVCRSSLPLKKSLIKNAYPGHIQKSDSRASGFAFVCGPDCPSKFPVSVYYSDGALAFKLGRYGIWEGNGRPRAYCGTGGVPRCSVSAVVKGSKASKRDGKIYISYGNGTCRTATPGSRNGSPF